MKNIFTEHPHSVGESYTKHFKMAFGFGFNMTKGGLACMLHAFLPFICKTTGSDILMAMTQKFIERMPNIDERVIKLSKTINQKIAIKKGFPVAEEVIMD